VKPSLQTIDYPGVIYSEGFTQECYRSETLTSYSLIFPGLFIVRASQLVCRSETLTKMRVDSTKSSIKGIMRIAGSEGFI